MPNRNLDLETAKAHCRNAIEEFSKGLELFEELHEEKNVEATTILANYYIHGVTALDKDVDKALSYFSFLSDMGEVSADVSIGNIYYEKKEYDKAVEMYEKVLEQEDTNFHSVVLNNMAVLYHLGLGVEKDTRKAMQYYKRSIGLGDASAKNNLKQLVETLSPDEIIELL
jgi:uncharacterized protein